MKNGIICGDAMVEKTSKGARMEYSAAYSTGRERVMNSRSITTTLRRI